MRETKACFCRRKKSQKTVAYVSKALNLNNEQDLLMDQFYKDKNLKFDLVTRFEVIFTFLN